MTKLLSMAFVVIIALMSALISVNSFLYSNAAEGVYKSDALNISVIPSYWLNSDDSGETINTLADSFFKTDKSLSFSILHKNNSMIQENYSVIGNETNRSFIKDLEDYISKLQGTYGVYYINLENKEIIGINENEEFIAASTIKIPINLYLAKLFDTGAIYPATTIGYMEEDYEGGTGAIQFQEEKGKYSYRELSRLSIVVSDNIATNMLLRALVKKNIKDYMRILGGEAVYDNKNISTPRDMAEYIKNIYEFSKKSEYGRELIYYLENTVFNDRIPLLLPKNISVAHKIGNQTNALHDIGIVYTDKPYIISVMSKDIDETEGYKAIAGISLMLYEYNILN